MDHIIDLSLTPYQKILLDNLFAGPALIVELLDSQKCNVNSTSEIDLFLLMNKEKLYQRLSNCNWKLCTSFFRSFLKAYVANNSNLLELPIQGNSSISKNNEIFLPIIKMGLINVKSKERLVYLRNFWKRKSQLYSKNFTIVKINKLYYCKILSYKKGKKPPKIKNYFDELHRYIDLVNLRILGDSKSFSKTNYNSMGVRTIPGGAIGLGKKR